MSVIVALTFRLLREEDLEPLGVLVRRCHPDRPTWPLAMYLACPTFGAWHEDTLIGYGSMSLMLTGETTSILGVDVGVHPDWRREGIAKTLYRLRRELGRAAGATGWVAIAVDGDATIAAWLAKRQMVPAGRVPQGAWTGADAVLYTGPLVEVD